MGVCTKLAVAPQVRDVKAAREKEQATAREQIEELRLKLQREKNQELQVCCGSLAMSRPSPYWAKEVSVAVFSPPSSSSSRCATV